MGKKNIEAQAISMLIQSTKQKMDYAVNSRYLFMWDKKQIQYYDLKYPLIKENRAYVNFKISSNQKNAFIKTIVPGNDPDKIAIVIE